MDTNLNSLVIDFFAYLVAALVTVAAIVDLRGRAGGWGLVDHPRGRKRHPKATPLVGGIAMLAGLLAGGAVAGGAAPFGWLVVACLIVVAAGVVDDLLDIGAIIRLAAQIAAALVLVGAGFVLTDLGAIATSGTYVELGVWTVPLTVFTVVGVINALNMSDGIDGLCGALALIAAVAMLLMAGLDQAWMLALLIAVVLGFLLFNLPLRGHASVFMGDAGSMLLGLVLAWHAVALSQGEGRAFAPVTALWFLAVPLMDTVSLIARRLVRGRSPFSADCAHLHHLLRTRFTARSTLLIETVIAAGLAMIGLAGEWIGISEVWMFWAFLALFVIYTAAADLWARRHRDSTEVFDSAK